VPAIGAGEGLFAIKFIDANYGVCMGGDVGVSSIFYSTTDGGEHWLIGAGPTAELLTGCAVIDGNRVWICNATGDAYYSNNYGVTWTQRVLPVVATILGDMDFSGEFVGAICGNYNDGVDDYGIVYRTINGGADWEYYIADTAFDVALEYYGLNALWICDANHVFAVGEPVDSAGLIMEVQNAGPA